MPPVMINYLNVLQQRFELPSVVKFKKKCGFLGWLLLRPESKEIVLFWLNIEWIYGVRSIVEVRGQKQIFCIEFMFPLAFKQNLL